MNTPDNSPQEPQQPSDEATPQPDITKPASALPLSLAMLRQQQQQEEQPNGQD